MTVAGSSRVDAQWLADFRRETGAVRGLDEVDRTCRQARARFGLPYHCFGLRLPTSFLDPDLFVYESFPAPFRDVYVAMDGLHVDPVLLRSYEQSAPVLWDEVFEQTPADTPSGRYVAQIRSIGLRAGLTCGYRSAGGEFSAFSVATSRDDAGVQRYLREIAPWVTLAGSLLHDAATRLMRLDDASVLTPRERECLLWCAEGHTTGETAERLQIKARTVTFHLRNVSAKLRVSSRQQAVARAVAMGIVEPRAVTMPIE